MESPVKDRSAVDIRETVQIYKATVPYQIGVHALSACDTVGCYCDTGKGRVVKVLQVGYFSRSGRHKVKGMQSPETGAIKTKLLSSKSKWETTKTTK